jgi:acetyl esterase
MDAVMVRAPNHARRAGGSAGDPAPAIAAIASDAFLDGVDGRLLLSRMPLDPQARALLDQMVAMAGPPLHTLPVPDARGLMAALAGMSGPSTAPLAKVENRTIPGPAGAMPVRVYTPKGETTLPLLVYFHGGGWVLGDLETHDSICRELAHGAGCVVMAVDYRLAPEHKFPAAADDCYAAVVWAARNAAEIGADPTRIAIAGDSAGGNLTCVTALQARDKGGPKLCFQLPVYPVTDHSFDTPSYRDNATGYLLETDAMVWFWNHYLRSKGDGAEPYASPLRATDLRGLPPALVITAEFDPLRDEGEAYAKRLRDADVPVTLHRFDGMIHGFFGMGAVMDQAKTAIAESCAALRKAFTRP